MENYPSGLRGSSLLLRSVRRCGRSNRSFSANIILECQHKIIIGTLIFYIMKNYLKIIFKNWNLFEILFLLIGLTIELIIFIVFGAQWYEILYSLTYFLTAILMAKGKYYCYIIGLISIAFYSLTSYYQSYYGEMIIALTMTLPLMVFGLISWKKNEDKQSNVVIIQKINKIEIILLIVSQVGLFWGYYFLLKVFNNANLILSSFSIAISFIASYLTFRRNNLGFIAFIINDLILIMLWGTPLTEGNLSILPVLVCPCLLLINDVYGYINWLRIVRQQEKNKQVGVVISAMDTYVYKIGNSLYINLTNRCSNRCTFCVRDQSDKYEGYSLWLKNGEPSAEQVIKEIGNPEQYDEIVFCGYGEPTYKLSSMLEICNYVHANGGKTRLNTNGHGSLINGRNIAPELVGKLDGINISLNASNDANYTAVCRPLVTGAYDAMLKFAMDCMVAGVNVWFSVVDCIGETQLKECHTIAENMGVPLRVRKFIET